MKVNIWQERVTFPTYKIGPPDKNPMFFENRVYQGSSGMVYPNPIIEKIEDEKVDQHYNALFLENKYLKVMILPEMGGRVHMAYDKIAQRHFVYYNQVIKPALIGLCGPWISGGIEFNWPQHHRPSTFEPIDYTIEENKDGSKTIWVSEVEKMFQTKGMAGFTLYPDKAYLEVKVNLYNRTNLPQTFLWWANPAVSANDHYQAVFPPDVNAVFDHGKRDVSSFPIATGVYYKVDYSPGTDISRYRNIPVPTSYMAANSNYNFMGGYEHDVKAGMLHIADHHISPGKKQWTWGNGDFGVAWNRNLTDGDGAYIELMTGVYSDNQPDFSWIMPYEEKCFTQYFLPYREVGLVKNANEDILMSLEKLNKKILVQIFATSVQSHLRVILTHKDQILLDEHTGISPEKIFQKEISAEEFELSGLTLIVNGRDNKEILRYPADLPEKENKMPGPALPALRPEDVDSPEQLFLTGQHLEQYRHATFSPVPYYQEALKRDPKDIRNNNALGTWYLRKGQFAKSESYFRKAIGTSVQRNSNPYDSEPYYNLGVSLNYQGKPNQAYDAFFKAAWSGAWQDAAYFSVAQIDVQRKDYQLALKHINYSLDRNARNGKAYFVKVHVLRKLKRVTEAIKLTTIALDRDHFNFSVLFELYFCYCELKKESNAEEVIDRLLKLSRGNVHNLIEYAIEYAALDLYHEAIELLLYTDSKECNDPMVNYYIGYYWNKGKNQELSVSYLKKANSLDLGICFPSRLEDINILQYALNNNPADARAAYLLGNLWYDKRQYDEAITCWRKSSMLNNTFPTTCRNLAIASYNKIKDPTMALALLERAYQLDKSDARVLMELDQLYKRLNYSAEFRLLHLQKQYAVAEQRDDLYLEIVALNNFLGTYEAAYQLILDRQFHPWEGGEGKVSGQYVYSLIELAKSEMESHQFRNAILKLEQAQHFPHNLGEGKLYGARENDIFYWLGSAYEGLNDTEKAKFYWNKAIQGVSEPSVATFYNDQQPDKIFYQGLAWEKLENQSCGDEVFNNLVQYGQAHENDKPKIDYFAVSLPDLLIFEDDLQKRNYVHCKYIAGLGFLGLKNFVETEKAFTAVLSEDAMHFGVKTHLKLLRSRKENPVSVQKTKG
jgi:tetratricopeptide (TPR) repeat protein